MNEICDLLLTFNVPSVLEGSQGYLRRGSIARRVPS
jgi:hypothetical protein